jgi:hypothetical protein
MLKTDPDAFVLAAAIGGIFMLALAVGLVLSW